MPLDLPPPPPPIVRVAEKVDEAELKKLIAKKCPDNKDARIIVDPNTGEIFLQSGEKTIVVPSVITGDNPNQQVEFDPSSRIQIASGALQTGHACLQLATKKQEMEQELKKGMRSYLYLLLDYLSKFGEKLREAEESLNRVLDNRI